MLLQDVIKKFTSLIFSFCCLYVCYKFDMVAKNGSLKIFDLKRFIHIVFFFNNGYFF